MKISQKSKIKRTCGQVDFPIPVGHRVKIKEIEKRDKYQDLARRQKTMEHECVGDSCCSSESLLNRAGRRRRNQRTSQDQSNSSIIKFGKNTEKSPGNLRRLADTETPVGKHRKE